MTDTAEAAKLAHDRAVAAARKHEVSVVTGRGNCGRLHGEWIDAEHKFAEALSAIPPPPVQGENKIVTGLKQAVMHAKIMREVHSRIASVCSDGNSDAQSLASEIATAVVHLLAAAAAAPPAVRMPDAIMRITRDDDPLGDRLRAYVKALDLTERPSADEDDLAADIRLVLAERFALSQRLLAVVRMPGRDDLVRAMCHVTGGPCTCADKSQTDDYSSCKIVARHANAILDSNILSLTPSDGWREIASAPAYAKGLMVDVFGGRYERPTEVEADGEYWRANTGKLKAIPTHWRPRPSPPQEEKG